MLQPKKKLDTRVNLLLPEELYVGIKFRAEAAGVSVQEAIRQYLERAINADQANGKDGHR